MAPGVSDYSSPPRLMITAAEKLQQLEAAFARQAYADMTYAAALERFTALLALAQEVRPVAEEDWLEDLEPDLAVARAVNGLPPAA